MHGLAIFPLAGARIYVAGHAGLVGSALCRLLADMDVTVLTAPRAELDLRHSEAVAHWLLQHQPDIVIVAAATVGGILANSTRPAEFLYDNMMIGANLVQGAYAAGVQRLLYLGSSCIYPRLAAQPIAESALLSGPLEPTNEAYAIAKIAGLKLVKAYRQQYGVPYIAAMPCNLYGPHDNFDALSAHVLPALMGRMHRAKMHGDAEMVLWGSGKPRREFLYVDDLARALLFLLQHYNEDDFINVGSGMDYPILDLANLLREIVGWSGQFVHDLSKPDGMPQKLLDCSRLQAIGWQPVMGLREGMTQTYAWYLQHGV